MQGNNPVFSRTEGFSGRQAGIDLATPRTEQLEDMYAAPSATPVQTGRMTYDDVVMKTGITFGVLLVGAVVGWQVPQLAFVGLIVGLGLGLVNAFKRDPSPVLILAYAAFEGLFVGGISFAFENMQVGTRADGTAITLDGIVAQAVLATLAVFAVSLWAYRSKKIRVTPRFQRGVMIALGGYLVFVVVNLLFQIFGSSDSPFGFRQGMLRHPDRAVRGRPGGVLPHPRLRLHRAGCQERSAGQVRVDRGLRAHGHAGLALHRDAPSARDPARRVADSTPRRPRPGVLGAGPSPSFSSFEGALGPPQVVLVHDRRGVAVGEAVLVAQPAHAVVEAQERGARFEGPEPLSEFSSGRLGNSGDQVAMGLLGVVQAHGRLRLSSRGSVI